MSEMDFDELDKELKPIQDRIAPLYVHPFYGLTELFAWLGRSNIALGIFTSGSAYHVVRNYGISLPVLGYTELYRNSQAGSQEMLSAFAERIKAVYGIANVAIITEGDVARTKPDPEGILKALDHLGLRPDEVIAIGDHPVDVAAASAAGVHLIGTTHGFSTAAELKAAGAVLTVSSLLDIPALIEVHNTGEKKLF